MPLFVRISYYSLEESYVEPAAGLNEQTTPDMLTLAFNKQECVKAWEAKGALLSPGDARYGAGFFYEIQSVEEGRGLAANDPMARDYMIIEASRNPDTQSAHPLDNADNWKFIEKNAVSSLRAQHPELVIPGA